MTGRRLFAHAYAPIAAAALFASVSHTALAADPSETAPKVVLISLDGARPDFINRYIDAGILPADGGLATIRAHGIYALQNVTANPSLTAVSHIAIATGSTSVHNDIPANTFKAVVQPATSYLSGFAAPIGGYQISPLGEANPTTAEPLWVALRAAGKKVVAATWPGADGATIALNGTTVQGPTDRTVDYTVPFGAFGGLSAQGFQFTAADFSDAPAALVTQLAAAGHPSFSPVKVGFVQTVYCSAAQTATCGTSPSDIRYDLSVAALDTTNDNVVNYDTLVFFDAQRPIPAGPFSAPATGPAYVEEHGNSQPFLFTGSGAVVGTSFYVAKLEPDLSSVRFVRYSANYIPRNAPVVANVDDINDTVGFWRAQADYRIPERLSTGFTTFPDQELEAVYLDQVKTFLRYQAALANHAIDVNRDADLVMIYFEQPDGSSHQFWLADPRQASNPQDPASIGANQDPAKVARYRAYRLNAYQRADAAVQSILATIGRRADGTPRSNVFVVSDHGFAPFHTAVSLANILSNAGIDLSKVTVRTSGPAANIYVNLVGRGLNGTVQPDEYATLVASIAKVLKQTRDANANYTQGHAAVPVFRSVETRPTSCGQPGYCTNSKIGQDFGDVFAVMNIGYNFDGLQSPVGVGRLGDPPYASTTSNFSVPNFYGAHGYDPALPAMSASFFASGPNIKASSSPVAKIANIDVAPTIMKILGVEPASTVDGKALVSILK